MSQLKYNECRRQCRYNFTQQEVNEIGKQAADDGHNKVMAEADLERIKKDYKARIEGYEAAIDAAFEKMRSGYELRETLCFFEYNKPRPGRKICRRADTLEVVGEEDMTGKDTQMVMEAVDAEAADAPEPKKEPMLVLPAGEPDVAPWPEPANIIAKKDPIYGSEKFSTSSCELFSGLLRECFYLPGDSTCANDDELREAVVGIVDQYKKEKHTLPDFLAWLEERPRPGARKVIAILREKDVKTPAEVSAKADTPAQPEQKKPCKKKGGDVAGKGRRTSRGGVVACESDGDTIDDPEANKSDY